MCGEVTDNPWLEIPAADYEGHMVWTLRAAYFPTPRHDGGEIGPR